MLFFSRFPQLTKITKKEKNYHWGENLQFGMLVRIIVLGIVVQWLVQHVLSKLHVQPPTIRNNFSHCQLNNVKLEASLCPFGYTFLSLFCSVAGDGKCISRQPSEFDISLWFPVLQNRILADTSFDWPGNLTGAWQQEKETKWSESDQNSFYRQCNELINLNF